MSAPCHAPRLFGACEIEPIDIAPPGDLASSRMFLPAPVMEVRPDRGPDRRPFEDNVFPFWARFPRGVPESALWSSAAQAWTSDYFTASAMQAEGGWAFENAIPRTLEHSMWFHRPVDPRAWLLVNAAPVCLRDQRYLAHGSIHDEAGEHAATFSQAGIIKPIARA